MSTESGDLRRSLRLLSSGYYGTDGKPTISYNKETIYQPFKSRKRRHQRFHPQPENTLFNGCGNQGLYCNNQGPSMGEQSIASKLLFWAKVVLLLTFCVLGGAFLVQAYAMSWSRPTMDTKMDQSMNGPAMMDTWTNGAMDAWMYRTMDRDIDRDMDRTMDRDRTIDGTMDGTMDRDIDGTMDGTMDRTINTNPVLAARVVNSHSSPTYYRLGWVQKIVCSRCRTGLNKAGDLKTGDCWPFAGARGHIHLELDQVSHLSHVSLRHIVPSQSPTGEIDTAPKDFLVYGMEAADGEEQLLGRFTYDKTGGSSQTFALKNLDQAFKHVRLQVESNWGNSEYTCLYEVRLHGQTGAAE